MKGSLSCFTEIVIYSFMYKCNGRNAQCFDPLALGLRTGEDPFDLSFGMCKMHSSSRALSLSQQSRKQELAGSCCVESESDCFCYHHVSFSLAEVSCLVLLLFIIICDVALAALPTCKDLVLGNGEGRVFLLRGRGSAKAAVLEDWGFVTDPD